MNRYIVILISIVVIAFYSCEKDPVEATNIKITADKTDIEVKTTVNFTFEGNAEFLTFYNGNVKAKFSNYPTDKGVPIDLKVKSYKVTYREPGTYVATIVAVSYGNYSKKESIVRDSVIINVK